MTTRALLSRSRPPVRPRSARSPAFPRARPPPSSASTPSLLGHADADAAGRAVAPVLSAIRVAPRVRLGASLPRMTKRRAAIAFRLSEPATVTLRFARAAPRRSWTTVGRRAVLAVPAGATRVVFQGRLARRSALKPGRYRVTIVATDAAGNRSAARTAALTVLARRR